MLAAVMDALPVGMAITDTAGGVLQVNAEYDRIWSGPPHGVRCVEEYDRFRAWWADSGERLRPGEWASAVAVRENRTVTGQVLEIERFDGTRAVVINGAAPIRDADGRVVGSAVAIQEITELRRVQDALRESDTRYRALAENFRVALKASPVTLATLDRDLRYTWVHNPRHGFSVEGIVGHRPDELVGSEHALELTSLLQDVLATGIPQQREVSGRTTNGQGRWDYLATVEPLRNDAGECVGVTMAIIDISARKVMEEELRERDRRRTEFLAVLSHELRNPLAPICSALQVLKLAPAGGPESQRAQEVLERQVGHMVRLVDDLLDASRINTNKIHVQRSSVDLVGLVARTVEDLRPLFANKGVDVEVALPAGPLRMDGDATRLAQAFGNLLHNAAKFTPPGGLARVQVSIDEGHERAFVTVADTGVGIPRDVLPTLFQPFMQVATTASGGLGLGLALVKAIVELHGGEVTAGSAGHGRGAEFRVALPLAAGVDREPSPPAAADSIADSDSRRVLVIDDNEDNAESLRLLLELSGHEVAVANDCVRGLAAVGSLRPHVVVCDLGLPGMDGFELARAIRGDASLKLPLLIALSGYALPADVQRSLHSGFDTHLAKPPDVQRLLALIRSVER